MSTSAQRVPNQMVASEDGFQTEHLPGTVHKIDSLHPPSPGFFEAAEALFPFSPFHKPTIFTPKTSSHYIAKARQPMNSELFSSHEFGLGLAAKTVQSGDNDSTTTGLIVQIPGHQIGLSPEIHLVHTPKTEHSKQLAKTGSHLPGLPVSGLSIQTSPVKLLKHTPGTTICNDTYFESNTFWKGEDMLNRADFQTNLALDCCRHCVELEECTHWIWNFGYCSLKQGRLDRVKVPIENSSPSSSFSGKVDVDTYLERLAKGNMKFQNSLGAVQKQLQCKYNSEDIEFFSLSEPSQR